MPYTFKATYDNFLLIGEDVSPDMVLIAARETPFLDTLSDPPFPATSTKHQWSEERIGPDRVVASTAVNSATAATGITINGFGQQLQVGMLLEVEQNAAGGVNEIVQITSIPGANSILVSRNYAARGISSLAVGGNLFIISPAELEGSETTGDVNRPRVRRENYTQIIKKPITVTGTDQSVMTAPDVGSEFDHQASLRMIEVMRDLEKVAIRGASANTIGTATATRTMDGLRQFLSTVNSTITAAAFATSPLYNTNALLQSAWNNGARDIDVILCGATWKRDLSATNASQVVVEQNDLGITLRKEYLDTDFGSARLILTPWLGDNHIMGVSTRRVRVLPLRGRSFQLERLAKTGDSVKGHVLGEYTLEVHHPDAMFQGHI